jgi:hypothetical protein
MKYLKIKPNETTVDHRYQRDLDGRRVDAMASGYNPSLVGVPVISRRGDGTLVRIDGQHRLAANIAAGHGDAAILMELHEELSLREEAELFLRLNGGRKAVGQIDKYRARLEAHEPVALDIQATLKRVGCKISKSLQRGGVMAVQAVEYAYHRGNLEPTMRVLVAWLDLDPAAFDGALIRAVSAFFTACPAAEPMHLANKLSTYAPQKLTARLRREQQLGSQSAEVARVVLTEIYNRGTAKAKRVTWHMSQDTKEVA